MLSLGGLEALRSFWNIVSNWGGLELSNSESQNDGVAYKSWLSLFFFFSFFSFYNYCNYRIIFIVIYVWKKKEKLGSNSRKCRIKTQKP